MRAVLGVVAVGVWAAGAAAAPVRLERVELHQGATSAVRLRMSSPVMPLARTLPADGPTPARIYIDFAGTAAAPELRTPIDGGGPIFRVRVGQFDPNTTRVVLDLAEPAGFEVRRQGRTVTIVLRHGADPPIETAAKSPQPAPAPPLASIPSPLLIVDAGHGGRDPGASGLWGAVEKDIALAVARALAAKLDERGIGQAVLTRNEDVYLPIDRRLPPADSPAALFVSLHANACADPTRKGLEVFYGGGRLQPASVGASPPEAGRLGLHVARALRRRLSGSVRGGPRPARYAVLARNPLPSVLIEIAYLTHPEDAARAKDPAFHDRVTDALADGIAAFLRSAEPRL